MKRFAALAALAIALAPSTADAEPRVGREWYGYQTLAFDAAAVTTIGLAIRSREYDEELAWATVLLYAFGGPSVHFAHGNVGRGFGSLGMRVGGPLVIGAGLCSLDNGGSNEFGCLGGFALGVLVGVPTAIIVDAAIAHDEIEIPNTHAGLRLQPTASLTKHGGTFGIGGSF